MVSEKLPRNHPVAWSKTGIIYLRTGLFISKIAQGLYTVCIAWSAFAVGGSVASVGLVLVGWSLITLVAGPFLGVITDNGDQRIMHGAARLVEIMLFLVIAALMHSDMGSVTLLILTACIASFAALIINPCLYVFIKQATDDKKALKQSVTAMAVMQAGLVVGTGSGGLLLANWGIAIGFLGCATASFVSCIFIILSKPTSLKLDSSPNDYFGNFFEGISIIRKNQQLRVLITGLTLAVSVGQVTISVLPAYVSNTLNGNAATYGLIDATYSVGSFIASIIVVLSLTKSTYRHLAPACLSLMAFLLITISCIRSYLLALVLFFLLGMTYSICRVSFDGAIQASTSNHTVGRVRNNTQSIIGFVGIVIYLLPTIVPHNNPSLFYAGYGILFLLLSIFAYRTSHLPDEATLRSQFNGKGRHLATKTGRSSLTP